MTAPDLSTYRTVHAALRLAPHRLASAARTLPPDDRRRARALARYWAGYAGEVLVHHTVEDDVFFPALVERVPEAAGLMTRTDAEHHRLDDLMAACQAAVEALATSVVPATRTELANRLEALALLMDDHLDFEDAEILPLFERHFDADEYERLDERAMKSLGVSSQALFTVPFIAASLTPTERAHLMADAPLIFRAILWLGRGRHARLDARCFGPAPRRQEVLT